MRVWAEILPQSFDQQAIKKIKNKTAVVTGAGGFLGRRVVARLKVLGWTVIEAFNGKMEVDGVTHGFDLNKPQTMKSIRSIVAMDALIHLGAKVGWNGETIQDLATPNIESTSELAIIANEKDAKIIFASAAVVYGSKTTLISSDSPLNPDTPYAESKLEAERMIIKAKTNHCILRFCGLWGERGPKHLMLNRAINKALDGKTPIIYGSGRAVRNYLYVMDAAEIVIDSLNEQKQGTYLVGGAERLSISEMLQKVCQVFLPGQVPQHVEHEEALDQIIESTYTILNRITFHEALIAIKKGLNY
jgi:UDP-glucose 4-epimerase